MTSFRLRLVSGLDVAVGGGDVGVEGTGEAVEAATTGFTSSSTSGIKTAGAGALIATCVAPQADRKDDRTISKQLLITIRRWSKG
jgi:hypothetical protein